MADKFRILLVDDDTIIIKTLKPILEDEGYIVDTAENGKEAVNKSNIHFYNIAIIDWKLPDTEGTKLLGHLKETIPRMKKIMLTGFPSMQNAIDSVNSQADAYFQKPSSTETLLKRIKDLLNQQQEERKYSEEKVSEFIQTRVKEFS